MLAKIIDKFCFGGISIFCEGKIIHEKSTKFASIFELYQVSMYNFLC